jgi:glycerol-3-phosphate dehydrogenase
VDAEVAIVGAGVVGSATALAVARRGASVALLEAEPAPGLAASGSNSGILHTGFDSPPGELETKLILRSAQLRDPLLDALGVPVLRCGAVVEDGREVPGESVTDPVAFTLGLATAATLHGAQLRSGFAVASIARDDEGLVLRSSAGDRVRARIAVNCAGLHADAVARLAGDDSFAIYPRKGEFLVFEPPHGETLERIMLPVPTKRTKGVLVFPTIDGMVIAGPTAVDQEDKDDWSVRPQARDEILPKAIAMWPPLARAEQVFAYAGLRPAGRGVNYLIGRSRANDRLVNVAAIRSTGLTASLGIAEQVCGILARLGVRLGPEQPLAPVEAPPARAPWWRRVAEHHGA